jgi:hypothetical protein
MVWKMGFELNDAIPDNVDVGTITATRDNPKFVFTVQGTVKDKDSILDQAEAAYKKYVDGLNSKADIEAAITAELQATADARPDVDVNVSPNVKVAKEISWEVPWKK